MYIVWGWDKRGEDGPHGNPIRTEGDTIGKCNYDLRSMTYRILEKIPKKQRGASSFWICFSAEEEQWLLQSFAALTIGRAVILSEHNIPLDYRLHTVIAGVMFPVIRLFFTSCSCALVFIPECGVWHSGAKPTLAIEVKGAETVIPHCG